MPSLVTGNEYMILMAALAVCIVGGFIVALFKR